MVLTAVIFSWITATATDDLEMKIYWQIKIY
jgi:hypothetical protein